MRRTINVFTSLIFIYSLIVCIACKQVSPDKVGNLEFQVLSIKASETRPVKQSNKQDQYSREEISKAVLLTSSEIELNIHAFFKRF